MSDQTWPDAWAIETTPEYEGAEIVLVTDPDIRWSDLVVLRGHFDNTRYAKLTVPNALFDDGPALAATVQRLYREAMDPERRRP